MTLFWLGIAEYWLAVCCAIFAATVVGQVTLNFATSRMHAIEVRQRCLGPSATVKTSKVALWRQDLLRNGVSQFRIIANRLLRLRPLKRLLLYYFESNILSTSLECALLLLVCVLVLSLLLLGNVTFGVIVYILGLVYLANRQRQIRQQQQKLLLDSLPEALKSIAMCYSAGISLELALEQTAIETAEPLRSELLQASSQMKTGKSATEALDSISQTQNTQADGFRFAMIALKIQHRTGGKLVDIIESAANSLTESAELKNDLRLKTAQARLSAKIVAILPLALVAILSLAMPNYLSNLLNSSSGLTILTVAAALEITGIVIIRRILGVQI